MELTMTYALILLLFVIILLVLSVKEALRENREAGEKICYIEIPGFVLIDVLGVFKKRFLQSIIAAGRLIT
jgi:hypothetical protein